MHELETERDRSAAYAATNPDPRGRSSRVGAQMREQQATVNDAVATVRAAAAGIDSSYSAAVRLKVRDIVNRLDGLKALRSVTTQTWLSPQAGIEKYSELIQALLDLNDDVADGILDPVLSATTRAEAALALAKDRASREGAFLHAVLIAGRFEPTELQAVQAARAQRDTEILAFQTAATPSQRQFFEDTVSGSDIDLGETLRQRIVSLASESKTLSVAPLTADDAVQWSTSTAATVNKMRTAERQLSDAIISRSDTLKSDARQAALIGGVLLFLVIFLVLLVTLVVARSLVRPLRRLRTGALDVASNRLPGLVDRLRDPDVASDGIEIDPIDVASTDEIGEVARAFDEVHREAVRLAANEAVLRGNINAMFVNLSRRSQSLIERQLRLIDELEQGERDDDRLASLFRLDHLATRMRRNCENLLVLGGQDQVRRWNQPVPLIDVVRASLSEVEQYERVGLRIQGEVAVGGPVVNDLVHLVAELVENATVFSPEHTKVTISGHLLSGGGAMLQITDNGVGMSSEELQAANWRLANPPVIDVSAARRMGLFVVGRLAARHGIRVELRAALSGGLTAFALLPAQAIAVGDTQSISPRRFDEATPVSPGRSVPAARPIAAPVAAVPQPAGPVHMARPMRAIPPREMADPAPHHPTRQVFAQETPPRGPFVPPAHRPQPIVSSEPKTPPPNRPASQPPQAQPPQAQPQQAQSQQAQPPQAPSRPAPSRPAPSGAAPPWEAAQAAEPGVGWGPPDPAAASRRAERSPIFEAMESEWFQRRKPSEIPETPAQGSWMSPGDEGRQAAEAVRQPVAGGHTSSGLPKRVPGKNRVPGSIPQSPPPQAAPPASAETVRARFSGLQRGVNRGRAQTQADGGQPREETGDTV
ncbi:sensor histidine kinase [Actinomadura scrupuli]|uniref:sensor histidine kinase n=1 Tax=Actinomadura scrupuli TaxID=559629 RepID=UPI003D99BEAB